MGYMYEENPDYSDKEYFDMIDKIENLKEKLTINKTALSNIMYEDIFESTKLEGNQLSRLEVTFYLDNGITVRGKSLQDYAQVHNYQNVMNAIKEGLLTQNKILSEDFILCIHKMITEDELPEQECGQYRQEPVHIRYTDYIPPIETEIPDLMKELVEKYNRPLEYETPFERICEFKRNFERIHPFIDGNGRTGRVLMNILFLQNGYGYISIPASERDMYFNSLDDNSFVRFMVPRMLQSMEKIQNRRITKEMGYEK